MSTVITPFLNIKFAPALEKVGAIFILQIIMFRDILKTTWEVKACPCDIKSTDFLPKQ